jgi:hypothetical protein
MDLKELEREEKPLPGRPMIQRTAKATQKWPCDDVQKFQLKEETAGLLNCYCSTYDKIFGLSGCKHEGEKRQFTTEGVRRLSALNRLYLSSPSTRAFIQAEWMKRALAQQKLIEEAQAKEKENAKEAGAP